MFVLVFWIRSKTTSVISEDDLCPSKEEGEETSAKFKNQKLYRVRIVKKSDDEDYLNCLRVTKMGELLRKGKNTMSEIALTENLHLKKNRQQSKRKAKSAGSKVLPDSPPIYEDLEDDDEHSDADGKELEEEPHKKIKRLEEELKKLKSTVESSKKQHSNVGSCTASTGERRNDSAAAGSSKLTAPGAASCSPGSAPESLPDNTVGDDPLELSKRPGQGRILLCEDFNVWIDKGKLTVLQRYQHDPNEMTRQLLKTLVGKNQLKNMCARGKSKKTPRVPAEIVNAVEYYVNKKCKKTLTPAQFTDVINRMCSTLRNPK